MDKKVYWRTAYQKRKNNPKKYRDYLDKQNIRNKKHFQKYPEKAKIRTRNWQRNNLDKVWGYGIKRDYKISVETYQAILDTQNGVCAICEKIEVHKKYKRLSVDHNHITGKVRGLLCSRCNLALGYLKEDTNIVNKLLDYINKFN